MEIYRIFNKKNGKCYIGCTMWKFSVRYPGGKWWKWSTNNPLLCAVEKYGLENFDKETLNTSAKSMEELLELEKLYIKQYNCRVPNGYNLTDGGGSLYPTSIKEYELIDSTGTIYNIKNLKRFCEKHKLSYSAMLNMTCGITQSSQGFTLSTNPIECIIKNPDEEWEIENVNTGEVSKVKRKNIPKFAKSINIKKQYIWALIRKNIYVTHGFKLKETIIDGVKIKKSVKKYNNVEFTNPGGKLVVIENIYDYCKKHSLNRGRFYDLICGKSLIYKGWTLPISNSELKEKQELRLGKEIKIKNIITNKEVILQNVSKFCRDNNLNLNAFNSMISGKIKQYMGYSLKNTDLNNYKYPKKIIYISLINDKGKIIEGKNPKDVENSHKIMTSASIHCMIRNEYNSIKGWKILKAKYHMNYYPEIDNTNKI